MGSGPKLLAGDKPERVWQEAHRLARIPAEPHDVWM
jgi:hypothetical protein